MSRQDSSQHFDPRRYRFTLRLTFAYEGENIRQVSSTRVQMLAPYAPFTPQPEGDIGFWIELQDREGKRLYAQAFNMPIRYAVEDYSPEGKIKRVSLAEPKGEFELLIPDIPEASALVMYTSPLNVENEMEVAKERARFDLRSSSGDEPMHQEKT